MFIHEYTKLLNCFNTQYALGFSIFVALSLFQLLQLEKMTISQVKSCHKMWNPFELSLQSHKGPDLLLTPINSELIWTLLIVHNDQLAFD